MVGAKPLGHGNSLGHGGAKPVHTVTLEWQNLVLLCNNSVWGTKPCKISHFGGIALEPQSSKTSDGFANAFELTLVFRKVNKLWGLFQEILATFPLLLTTPRRSGEFSSKMLVTVYSFLDADL